MDNTQDMASFQATQLAELDKQLALWDQRLKQIDQKISVTTQALKDAVSQLKAHMTNLVAAADEWLAQVAMDPEVSTTLQASVQTTRANIVELYGKLDGPADQTTLLDVSTLATELQTLSQELLLNLSAQAQVFAAALDQATSDLLTHYGIQI